MKSFAFLALVGLFTFPAALAHAQFFNDSNVINLGGAGDTGGNGEGGTFGEGGSGGTGGSTGGSSTGGSGSGGGSSEDDESLFGENAEDGEEDEGTTFGSILVTLPGDNGSSETQSQNASSIIGALQEGGAYANGASGGVLDAAHIRLLLSSRGISAIQLPDSGARPAESWGKPVPRVSYTRDDVALIISSAVLGDANITVVDFTADGLILSYRAFGRLLFFIPHRFTTRITIDFDAPTKAERVQVKFPWYSFFLRTGVSRNSLINQLDTTVLANQKQAGEEVSGFDITARMFTGVTDVLRARYGAIDVSSI